MLDSAVNQADMRVVCDSLSTCAVRVTRCTALVPAMFPLLLLLLLAASTSASERQARRLPNEDAWAAGGHVDNHVSPEELARSREEGREEGREAAALADVARSVVARTASTSQVLSLNLTNLLILLVLKALLFGAGIFSFGLLGKHHYGRAATAPDGGVTEAELALALAFLSGEAAPGGGHECLQRAACLAPSTASRYAVAASAALAAVKAFPGVMRYNPHYEEIISGMRTAVEFSKSGGLCAERYKCSDK
ncbi:uncharacterized protein LOC126424715 [Schistocerca serialis cubense]|uniref:uncharacterized protein LOC126424715 n=1 Tax=Schistocerca serialis cubense TaxID=2023355 RepID=UPI00214DF910|nr:uncharacterized protein LOC126424715 [Schistocerca serialis cubense]